jgi:hypothetical protein
MLKEKEAFLIPAAALPVAQSGKERSQRNPANPGLKMLLEKINLIFPINLHRNRHPLTRNA